jgi:hypothetical protein
MPTKQSRSNLYGAKAESLLACTRINKPTGGPPKQRVCLTWELLMRSEKKSLVGDEILIRLTGLPAHEIEHRVRAYRARLIGDLLGTAIRWLANLPRRLMEPMALEARKQRV